MPRSLSKEVVLSAFRQLHSLNDDPSTQGQTQKTSSLRYAAALDAFKGRCQRDCDTTNADDKKLFIDLVGDVVKLSAGYYTTDFYKTVKTLDDYGVGSNFYSANVVPNSRLDPSKKFPFPRRMAPLFEVQNRMLLVDSIRYNNLSEYLSTPSLRCAFAVWLMRYQVFEDTADNESFDQSLKKAFCRVYSEQFASALWASGAISYKLLTNKPIDAFADKVSKITKDDIAGLWETSQPSANRQKEAMSEPHNLIYFGAPGTGKSYQLNQNAAQCFDKENVTRVTFHPDYTYAQFVGCLKPFSKPVIDENDPPARIEDAPTTIEYEFAVGPFIETYIKAIKHPDQNFLLVVEEINRANPAAVFGDVFQLLDRDESGVSEYPVATSKDLRWPLFKVWKSILNAKDPNRANMYSLDDPEASEKASTLVLPGNLYIWATMNSADQGVFPMDTAFKRRWDFRYMDIDDKVSVAEIAGYDVPLGKTGERIKWNNLRVGINNVLRKANINEDKWLGPFFIKPSVLEDDDAFANAFKDKVLLYLYEDAAKSKPGKVFADRNLTYSEICRKFERDGVDVFCDFEVVKASSSADDADSDEVDTATEA